MLIVCTNKGCLQPSEAKVDKSTGEVICANCGKPIANVTEFAKKTLITLGQIVRTTGYKPFQVQCPKCVARRDISLSGDVAHCATCGSELHMSAAFLKAFKLHLEQKDKEIQ